MVLTHKYEIKRITNNISNIHHTSPNNKIMTTYTETELLGKKITELKDICKSLNVMCSGKKSVLIERILNPEEHQKKKKEKKEKKSAYYAIFNDGTNSDVAKLIANYHTEIHSTKIKAGNTLEDDVFEDGKEHSTFNFYKGVNIDDESIVTPSVIASCKFSKSQYELYGLSCKNKQCVEVDLVIVDSEKTVTLVELKNGCDFDTKKSKGEVQSLEATKILCENMGFVKVTCNIVCYDAVELSDMKLKTTMGQVQTMLYNDFAEKCGLNGVDSRERINKKVQLRAKDNVKKFEAVIAAYMALKN